MGIIEFIKNAFKKAFDFIKRIIRQIIVGIINFIDHVKKWFKSLMLVRGHDIPFLGKKEDFKEMLKNAPVKDEGIFEGVYNADTDSITHIQYLDADDMDNKTKEVIGNESLVVLC